MSTTWNDVQAKASTPGSAILTQWRAGREASRRGPDIQNSNGQTQWIASSDPRVIELLGSSPAAAGVAVTPLSSQRVSAVYACVTRIAGGVSQLPLRHYERVDGGRKAVLDSPYWWMFNESPHAGWTSASMWELIVQSFLLRESGFCYLRRNKVGEIREAVPLPWEGVTPEKYKTDENSYRLKYFINDGLRSYGADQDDMLHIPGFGFDGLRAMSVIQYAARNATGNALAMDEYSGRFFANGSHHSIVLEATGKMTDDKITSLQHAYANKYSGLGNAHRLPLVLTEGLKAKEVSITAQDAQLLDARKFQVVDIARAFGVPPHLIGETSAATSWGSGLEEMTRAFMLYTVQPHLRRIEQELNRKIFRTSKFYLEFDRDAMLEGNSKAQADYFRAALGGPGSGPGWMTVDEVRQRKNLPPNFGASAELFRPESKPTQTPKPTEEGPQE